MKFENKPGRPAYRRKQMVSNLLLIVVEHGSKLAQIHHNIPATHASGDIVVTLSARSPELHEAAACQ